MVIHKIDVFTQLIQPPTHQKQTDSSRHIDTLIAKAVLFGISQIFYNIRNVQLILITDKNTMKFASNYNNMAQNYKSCRTCLTSVVLVKLKVNQHLY